MDQQKIDRLFREKLGSMEVTPSSKAWSQVEKQIRPKKNPYCVLGSGFSKLITHFMDRLARCFTAELYTCSLRSESSC